MSNTSSRRDRDAEFGREIAIIGTIWTAVIVTAGILLIVFNDVFAGFV